MDWDKLRIFHAVARAGSFTGAGTVLNLSQSAISRQVSALEQSLDVVLFHRHARGIILTEQGETLYRTAQEVSTRLLMAQAALSEAAEMPSGELRITTTVAFGSTWLTPRIGEFLDLYPDISVSVTLLVEDRELDLGMREADIAIRMRRAAHPDLVQRRLLTVHNHMYASPEYLQRYGRPQTVADLDQHRVLGWGDVPAPVGDVNWLVTMDTGCCWRSKVASGSPRCPTTWCARIPASRASYRKSRARFTTPTSCTPKSCGTRNGSPSSATSCSTRSRTGSSKAPCAEIPSIPRLLAAAKFKGDRISGGLSDTLEHDA